ncbi:hypothetical protein SCHPADRAFT_827061 [Schizopora paradoxa]|uniref:Uncharacterized protein n=1 Tax=Schizopora paradoxa TaxID=27342 RepID=A0A0H2RPZ6_9AGAM|nr:hypothetical protein SCHPADRAFT_827061 [Schizopora paradoxa]
MTETSRSLEAAAALSRVLTAQGIPHAFHGTILVSMLSRNHSCSEVLCIVDGGNVHPFGRVRAALEGNDTLTASNAPWANRLHVVYNPPIPPVTIEILPAGEEGPRRLDGGTVSIISDLPFLTVSEFLRAKLNAWSLRSQVHDAQDIVWTLGRYWQNVDINRIPEEDMAKFIAQYPAAAEAWLAVKQRYT